MPSQHVLFPYSLTRCGSLSAHPLICPSIQFPLCGRLICCLLPLSVIYRPWCTHAACPLLQPRSSFADGKQEKHWSHPQPPTLLPHSPLPEELIRCRENDFCHHHAWVYTHEAGEGTHNPFCLQQLVPCLLSPPGMLGMGQSNTDPPRSKLLRTHLHHTQKSGWVLGTRNTNSPQVLTHQPSTDLQLRDEPTSHSSSLRTRE